ncbi:integrase core domain-containing protein [Aquimarina litoralis]|uniref:integrase core domain-containing protein n=1 Tax=Aquimarina litoralis TaxID=584605 RepID=UPI003CD0ACD3
MEGFNRKFREDMLDAYLLQSLKQFHLITDKTITDYNHNHPYESFRGKSSRYICKKKNPIVSLNRQWDQ